MLILKHVKDVIIKHRAHVSRAILLSITIKHPANIWYIFVCVFLYKSVNARHSVHFLTLFPPLTKQAKKTIMGPFFQPTTVHNQYLEGTLQQTNSKKQNI